MTRLAILAALLSVSSAPVTLAPPPKPAIGFFRVELVPVPLTDWTLAHYGNGVDRNLKIHNSYTLVVDGPLPYARVTAPNAFRDPDGRCYSLNVIRIDGARAPVECPL